ncbi:MAG: hypothetical protein D6722_28155, partial [Bacteroidetes bacterium]
LPAYGVRKSLTWPAKLGFSSLSAHKVSAQNQEAIFLALLKGRKGMAFPKAQPGTSNQELRTIN